MCNSPAHLAAIIPTTGEQKSSFPPSNFPYNGNPVNMRGGIILTYETRSAQEQKKQLLAEQLWLHYYNQVLFDKGLISEQERNSMTVRINHRGQSLSISEPS